MCIRDRTIAVRRAAFDVPIEEIRAVTQVPIFIPKRTYIALSIVIRPGVNAKACKTPIEAEEDCIIPVKTAPTKIPIKGFLKAVNIL